MEAGVRTFQTAYGTDGAIHHIGSSFQKIEEELIVYDVSRHAKIKDFQNLTKKERKKKKQNYRYRYLRCFERTQPHQRPAPQGRVVALQALSHHFTAKIRDAKHGFGRQVASNVSNDDDMVSL